MKTSNLRKYCFLKLKFCGHAVVYFLIMRLSVDQDISHDFLFPMFLILFAVTFCPVCYFVKFVCDDIHDITIKSA
jgi:uncharacterized protein (DUF2225 family)